MSDADDSEIEGFLSGHKPFENPPICPCGTCVGDWKILAFLGRGGSSEVYRAENTVTGQVAALKVLARTDGKTRERFKREVRLVAETQNAAFPKFYLSPKRKTRRFPSSTGPERRTAGSTSPRNFWSLSCCLRGMRRWHGSSLMSRRAWRNCIGLDLSIVTSSLGT